MGYAGFLAPTGDGHISSHRRKNSTGGLLTIGQKDHSLGSGHGPTSPHLMGGPPCRHPTHAPSLPYSAPTGVLDRAT
jgi:hypothetical protein